MLSAYFINLTVERGCKRREKKINLPSYVTREKNSHDLLSVASDQDPI